MVLPTTKGHTMKLIGISITPSFGDVEQREVESLAAKTAGIDIGPINSSN